MPTSEPWEEALVRYLVGGGTQGRRQSEIVTYFKNRALSAEIENELKALWVQFKVDRYTVPAKGPRSGRPTTVWRATDKIYTSGDVDLSISQDEKKAVDNEEGEPGDGITVLDVVSVERNNKNLSHDKDDSVPSRKKSRVREVNAKDKASGRRKVPPRGRFKGK